MYDTVTSRWMQSLVGRYINVGRRERILEVGDYEPSDHSVGIWHGFIQVRTKSGWYDAITNGTLDKVEEDKVASGVGTHNLFADCDGF